jgi:glycosyltransferase involved in cell wall biosynthesis
VTVPWSLFLFRGQARVLRESGLDVTIIYSPGELLDAFGRDEGVATCDVPMRRAISPLHDLGAIARLARTLRAIRPDIVHAHTPKGGLIGMIAAWLTRSPVRIYHIRGLPYMTTPGWRGRVMRWSEWISCRLAHRVFCVSHSIREVAVRDGLCPPGKIVVFLGGSGNGVDASGRFNPDRFSAEDRVAARAALGIGADDLVIGYVGRLVRDKGVEELAEAWLGLRKRYPDAHLLLVGPEEAKDAISPETLSRFRDDPRVHLVGDVADPSCFYAAMDIVALPTYREGFPNVPLEAAAMQLPVVATDVPGCVDAVEGDVTGTLVPPRDAGALRDALAHYLDDSPLRQQHGAAGRERVLRRFRQEDLWAEYRAEYERLLNAHASGSRDSGSKGHTDG